MLEMQINIVDFVLPMKWVNVSLTQTDPDEVVFINKF